MSRFDEIRARADAAREGPWSWQEEDEATIAIVSEGKWSTPVAYLDATAAADATFIARARDDIPMFLDLVDAIRDLHARDVETELWCWQCALPWPCPTVRLIDGTYTIENTL